MLSLVELILLLCIVLLINMYCLQTAQAHEVCLQSSQRCSVQPLKDFKTENSEERYPRLLVFVSFSMPIATLKQLSLQAQEAEGKLVFRGLVNNNFRETIPKLKELGAEVLIDPTLFRSYKVDKVPAFVLQERSPASPGEHVRHDILYGNVSLHYVLKQFSEEGDFVPARLKQE